MDMENRMVLMKESKMARRLEQVREHWDEFQPLIEREEAKVREKKPLVYEDAGGGESEMVVCVRVRPR